jgi:hypothetical protein
MKDGVTRDGVVPGGMTCIARTGMAEPAIVLIGLERARLERFVRFARRERRELRSGGATLLGIHAEQQEFLE